MSNHPNFDRTQAVLDAVRKGDYAPAFDLYADDILMENGPGAGPWHCGRGKDDMALMLTEFAGFFGRRSSRSSSRAWPPRPTWTRGVHVGRGQWFGGLSMAVVDERLPGDRQGVGDPIPAFRRDSYPTAQYDHDARDHH